MLVCVVLHCSVQRQRGQRSSLQLSDVAAAVYAGMPQQQEQLASIRRKAAVTSTRLHWQVRDTMLAVFSNYLYSVQAAVAAECWQLNRASCQQMCVQSVLLHVASANSDVLLCGLQVVRPRTYAGDLALTAHQRSIKGLAQVRGACRLAAMLPIGQGYACYCLASCITAKA
jgi:hypothetical protein